MKKKATITTKSIFFILMSIIMVWIMVFGINKIFLIEKTLEDQDKLIIKKELITALKYCQDPLNKGNLKTIELKKYGFNSICLLNKTTELSLIEILKTNAVLIDEVEILRESINLTDSIAVLMKTVIDSNSNLILEVNIIDDIIFKNMDIKNFCQWDIENEDNLDLKIEC